MRFIHIVFMIVGFQEKIEPQHVADPQMEKLLKMMEEPEIILREERQILDLQLETKREQSKMMEEPEIILREEGQIFDLQLETKREQFKMKNGKCPKLFGSLSGPR